MWQESAEDDSPLWGCEPWATAWARWWWQVQLRRDPSPETELHNKPTGGGTHSMTWPCGGGAKPSKGTLYVLLSMVMQTHWWYWKGRQIRYATHFTGILSLVLWLDILQPQLFFTNTYSVKSSLTFLKFLITLLHHYDVLSHKWTWKQRKVSLDTCTILFFYYFYAQKWKTSKTLPTDMIWVTASSNILDPG